MARKPKLSKKECMDARKVNKAVRKAGLDVRQGKGDHVVVYSPDGDDSVVYCDRDMGYGLASTIHKKLLSWGVIIGALALVAWILL